jgi:hypothetical protein
LASLGAVLPAGFVLADGVPLASYRAIEDLTLDPGDADQDVAAVSGRLVTEFTGSACAGYTTTTRMVIQATDSDGTRKVNDVRTLTVETLAGRLDFDNQSFIDGKLDQASKGTAERSGGQITVHLARPEKKTVALDAALVFPTEQVVRIIAAARAGKRFLSFTAYDGLDDGESPAPTSMIIGKGSTDPSDVDDETAVAEAGIAGLEHWPLTVTYFSNDSTSDQKPDFTLSGILYENGVMREQRLDFGSFALIGKIVGLSLLPAKPCP